MDESPNTRLELLDVEVDEQAEVTAIAGPRPAMPPARHAAEEAQPVLAIRI